jgi:hypothetical protein
MRRARPLLLFVIVATLVAVLAAPAVAAPLLQATETPTPTATPSSVRVVTLDSANEVVIEHSATDGEKAIFLALVVLIASLWLQWMYQQAQQLMG